MSSSLCLRSCYCVVSYAGQLRHNFLSCRFVTLVEVLPWVMLCALTVSDLKGTSEKKAASVNFQRKLAWKVRKIPLEGKDFLTFWKAAFTVQPWNDIFGVSGLSFGATCPGLTSYFTLFHSFSCTCLEGGASLKQCENRFKKSIQRLHSFCYYVHSCLSMQLFCFQESIYIFLNTYLAIVPLGGLCLFIFKWK